MSNAIQCHWVINNNASILWYLTVGGALRMGGIIWGGGGGAEVFPKTFKIGGVKIKLHCGTLEI